MTASSHASRDVFDGVTPFPADYAARYRAKGYWQDKPMRQVFGEWCQAHAPKIALRDATRSVTFAELDAASTNLALNLLDVGILPGDKLVVQLPNVIEFVYLHFALQKIGAIPVLALPPHRYREISCFVEMAEAVALITPDAQGDFRYTQMTERLRNEAPRLRFGIVLGDAPEGFVSLRDLIERPPARDASELDNIAIDPCSPALFLLSGGTTGIPKLIPRTHNDYVLNSKLAAAVCDIRDGDVLLDVLPIGHNLPLACPGLQGFLSRGCTVVLHTSTSSDQIFPLIDRYKVTHIHVVPALLIRWLESPVIADFDLGSVRVIQSGGQRLQPETRKRTQQRLPQCFVQENFGMAEGVLMFVRADDPLEVRMETVGRPVCEDDEVMLLGEDDQPVQPGEVGELCCRGPYTLRGYYRAPEHNARAFTSDGFYRSGDLMRQHPSGNYIVEGRKKDLINRGAEKISAEEIENLILAHPAVVNVACVAMPDPLMGERNCACLILREGVSLSLDELVAFLKNQEIAKFKLPERVEIFTSFPLSNFGKVSKKDLAATVAERVQAAQ
ncbi:MULTISPECIES: (2,3-dihydroxybenzoyl)adenylate synthase [Burkholderia cepacia complex]|uniref:(2,3-dihydroxybenzoyl)adenylate synthase n=1 Tax=Burkholderia cepacia complex TaxID=87882 RepID=UPI000052E856|nr:MULTISPECIES: AMP-binding protein [Burkholderia cepacia complex]ABK06929.1 AMP-dependent synthetase and ligase [Burkholderia cenocepacia HI2424]MCA8334069.1 AMP-binding protein [Burkholderia cepacia]MDN7914173.1 AMP-binding protein [Burkholderia cepacia]CAG9202906.1 Salicylyl-CoA synthase / salicylate adenylyltransferase [Burkholderia vietnamiensis]